MEHSTHGTNVNRRSTAAQVRMTPHQSTITEHLVHATTGRSFSAAFGRANTPDTRPSHQVPRSLKALTRIDQTTGTRLGSIFMTSPIHGTDEKARRTESTSGEER